MNGYYAKNIDSRRLLDYRKIEYFKAIASEHLVDFTAKNLFLQSFVPELHFASLCQKYVKSHKRLSHMKDDCADDQIHLGVKNRQS